MTFSFDYPLNEGSEPKGYYSVACIQHNDMTVTISTVEYTSTSGTKQWLHLEMIEGSGWYDKLIDAAHNYLSGDNVLDVTTDMQNDHYCQTQGKLG